MILYGAEMGVDLKFKSVYILFGSNCKDLYCFVKVVKKQRYNLETNNCSWRFAYAIVINIGCFFQGDLQQFGNKRIT